MSLISEPQTGKVTSDESKEVNIIVFDTKMDSFAAKFSFFCNEKH